MTVDDTASAPAGATGNLRPSRLTADAAAAGLSEPMRRALLHAQEDLFTDKAVVTGHGMTLKALRRRQIAALSQRITILTAFGRAVIAADPRIGGGAA